MAALSVPILRSASRGHILSCMRSFSGMPARQWLAAGHPAEHGNLPRDWNVVSNLPSSQLIEAVAVSAPNHCLDGWTFLARSLQALTAGDFHAARHLAYYSQLRSSLSLLANLGVGIFNGINFVVNQNGNIARLDPGGRRPRAGRPDIGAGTHNIVWDSLKEWTSQPAQAAAFLDLLRISGVPLGDGLEAIWPGARSAFTANLIIEGWGLDLRRGRSEHVFRNISSYQPHLLNDISDATDDCLDLLDDFWTYLEPLSDDGFELLDRHLFRNLLWELHRTTNPNISRAQGMISHGYGRLPARLRRTMTLDFLVGNDEPQEISLLRLARSTADPASAREMIARALMLGRAAIGFTSSSLRNAGAPDMTPLIDELVVSRGLLPPGSPLDNPTDLWVDVELARDDLRSSRSQPLGNLYSWLQSLSTGLPTLAQAERVSAWGLG